MILVSLVLLMEERLGRNLNRLWIWGNTVDYLNLKSCSDSNILVNTKTVKFLCLPCGLTVPRTHQWRGTGSGPGYSRRILSPIRFVPRMTANGANLKFTASEKPQWFLFAPPEIISPPLWESCYSQSRRYQRGSVLELYVSLDQGKT